MNKLLREIIYETILSDLSERKSNKPPKNITKGEKYKCTVKETDNENFKREIKNKHKNKKIIMVKVIEPDGRGDFSVIELDKKTYMVRTSSLK